MGNVVVRYQIERADYVEANVIVAAGRKRWTWETWCFFGSAVLLGVVPITYKVSGKEWDYPFVVLPFASFQLYCVLLHTFRGLNARRHYKASFLIGKWFVATGSESGVRIEATGVTWETRWSAFPYIGQSARIFLLHDGFTMYILAKRYFTPEQLIDFERLIKENWAPGISSAPLKASQS
jgi:hypothetical protein